MSGFTRNAIYNYAEHRINTTATPCYCTSRDYQVFPSYPACKIVEIDRNNDLLFVNLANTDEQWNVSFEVQAFSNKESGALDECYGIIQRAESAFRDMGFHETFCAPIETNDNTKERIVARFQRFVGSGDIMPTT